MSENKNPWKTLSEKTVYDNPWISVSHREVINPGGGEGIYGLVHFKNTAIGIIPLDEDNNTWLVGQYRYPLKAYSWEIPEGGGKPEEDPLIGAKRELIEETGIRAGDWLKIADCALSNSVCDEKGVIFLARDLSYGASEPEESEDLKLLKLPFAEAYEMAMQGKITDSMSLIGLLKTKILMDKGVI